MTPRYGADGGVSLMSVERRLTEQFMMRCDTPGCREYFHQTGPYDERGGHEDKAFRLGWRRVAHPGSFKTVMADDYCPKCTKEREERADANYGS